MFQVSVVEAWGWWWAQKYQSRQVRRQRQRRRAAPTQELANACAKASAAIDSSETA